MSSGVPLAIPPPGLPHIPGIRPSVSGGSSKLSLNLSPVTHKPHPIANERIAHLGNHSGPCKSKAMFGDKYSNKIDEMLGGTKNCYTYTRGGPGMWINLNNK